MRPSCGATPRHRPPPVWRDSPGTPSSTRTRAYGSRLDPATDGRDRLRKAFHQDSTRERLAHLAQLVGGPDPLDARRTQEATGWPESKITTIPNWVDTEQLDRPKAPGARFRLGMIGIAPSRKRLDLGLDVLEKLRARDRRWHLSVKSKPAWEYWWIWKKPEERAHYDDVLRRIRTSPLLEGAVVFDEFGPDVASWLRRVGHVLSTSDDESFHLSPAEGMASGAVPALLPWPGADEIYDRRWIHDSPEAMAEAVAGLVEETDGPGDPWRAAGQEARRQARETFALERVAETWTELLIPR